MIGKRFILVGGGALAREIFNIFNNENYFNFNTKLGYYIGFKDSQLNNEKYELQHLGEIQDFTPEAEDHLIVAIGNPQKKQKLLDQLRSKGAKFESLIHKTAFVSETAEMGEGVVLFPMSVVSADAKIGDFVTINFLSTIGHDVKIGDYSTLSGHVDLTGGVEIGTNCFFGTGSRVLPNIKIGDSSTIGAGSTIYRNVMSNSIMFSQPARKL
jgi:sugar O-acyltransferase (sialic acid O-acetyltransferase NeuD family)